MLKYAIEHFRARMFSCSGALFWQYNDMWPTLTFSVVDYYLNKKISYYWVRKAYSPVLVTFIECTGKGIEIWGINDLPRELDATLRLCQKTFKGKTSLDEEIKIRLPAAGACKIRRLEQSDLPINARDQFLLARIAVNGMVESENTHFFGLERDWLLPHCRLTSRIEQIGNRKYTMRVSSDGYARLVAIETGTVECGLSDNYFDIVPGEIKKIEITIKGRRQPSIQAEVFKAKALNS